VRGTGTMGNSSPLRGANTLFLTPLQVSETMHRAQELLTGEQSLDFAHMN
jgi:hypothetical protein